MTLYYSLVSKLPTSITMIQQLANSPQPSRSSSSSWQRWLCSWFSSSLSPSPSRGSCLRTIDPSSDFRQIRPAPLWCVADWLTLVLLYSFISENPIVAKLQYGLKITFIFILILFIDSVNRVYRVQIELAQASEGNNAAYV